MASVILTNAYRSVDQFWIKEISVEAQGAVGASVFVLIGLTSAFWLTAIGIAPLVSRATGAGDPALRRRVVGTGMSLAIGVGVLIGAVLVLGAEPIAGALGLTGQTAVECSRYLAALGWTIVPLALTPLVDQAFIAMGDTRTPMWLQGLSLLLNIVWTPLCVMDQVGPVPGLGLGVVGAALASNASRFVSTALGLVLLWRRLELRLALLRPSLDQARRIVKVGTPMAAGTFLYAAVYWAMLKTAISPLGPEVNAALGIGFSALEGFTWPAFWGISLAVSSVVGRALGAGAPEVAQAAVKKAFFLSTAAGLAAALLFYFGGEELTSWFSASPEVHEAATQYATILAFSQVFVAWEALGEGVLTGAGDTRTVFWLSVPLNLLRIPLSIVGAGALGAAGIWWAVNLTTVAKSLLKGGACLRGRWLEHEV